MEGEEIEQQNTLPLPTPAERITPPLFENLKQIDKYKIVSLLQSGGMSLLYLATDSCSSLSAVVKVLLPKFLSREDVVERFLREAEILFLLDHPNIVKMYSHGKWEGGYFIALEFIMGGSLRQYLLHQPISLKRALEIILEISYAICHLHTHGIIHRDLKLENILVTEEGGIKLIDFGIAQLLDEVKNEKPGLIKHRTIGTPIYMSPEQQANPENVSYSSDIYSLGIIAYELVLGKLSQGHVHLYLMPKGLQKILAKALQPNPLERYQDIVDFISDLTAYLNSEAIQKEGKIGDRISEFYDSLLQTQRILLPQVAPIFPNLLIGHAIGSTFLQTYAYGDFFPLDPNQLAVVFGESLAKDAEGIISSASVRGMIRILLKRNQNLKDFAEALNAILWEDFHSAPFALCCLIINPLQRLARCLLCGYGKMWRIPKGVGPPECIYMDSQPLRFAHAEYREKSFNFEFNDEILIFGSSQCTPEIEALLMQGLIEYSDMAPQQRAEGMMRKIKLHTVASVPFHFTITLIRNMGNVDKGD